MANDLQPAVVTKAGAMAELFAVLDCLTAADVYALTVFARDLAEGRTPDAPRGQLEPLTLEQTPLANVFNSVLGFTADGK